MNKQSIEGGLKDPSQYLSKENSLPRLEEQESRKLYYFYSEQTGRKLRKFSGDGVSDRDVSDFEIPPWLLEEKKEKK